MLTNRDYFENSEALISIEGVVIKSKGVLLYTQIPNIENKPDFKRVWEEYDMVGTDYITIDKDIVDAVERCTIILPQDVKPIELSLSKGVITMISESSYGVMNIPVKVANKDEANITVDGVYLEPFIKQVDEFAIKQKVIVGNKSNYSRLTAGIVLS